jgi:hypothetical protein
MAASTTLELEVPAAASSASRTQRALLLADRHPWLIAGLLSLVGWSLAVRDQYPTDYGVFTGPGSNLLHLHWDRVFDDPTVQTGPLTLVVFGAWHLVMTGLGLAPSVIMGLTVLALCFNNAACAIAVTRVLSRPDPVRRGLSMGIVGLLALANGALTLDDAHPTHAAIGLLWVLVVRAAQRGAAWRAGLLLGLACGFDSWAVLGIGALVLLPSLREGLRALVTTGAVCLALWGPFALTGHFRSASMTWNAVPGSLPFVLFGSADLPWAYRLIQSLAVVGLSALVATRLRGWRNLAWLLPAFVVALRLATDPMNYTYYASPFIILLVAGAVVGVVERRPGRFPLGDGAAQLTWLRRAACRVDLLVLAALAIAAAGQAMSGPLLGYALASFVITVAAWTARPVSG